MIDLVPHFVETCFVLDSGKFSSGPQVTWKHDVRSDHLDRTKYNERC